MKTTYDHPVYSTESVAAQARWREIGGHDGIHYCGAYWGWGFHEDGVRSALRACEPFGAPAPVSSPRFAEREELPLAA